MRFITLLFLIIPFLNANSQIKYSIPFELIDYRIYLKGTINNVECSFLYDTGAFGVDLDKLFIKNNGIKIPKYPKRKAFVINLNEYKKEITSVRSVDINIIGGNADEGILGINFFKDYIVEIDYEQQVINLFDINSVISNEYSKVEAKQLKGLMHYGKFCTDLEILFNDSIIYNGEFIFDTGSGRNITLFDEVKSEKESGNPVRKGMNSSFHGINLSEYVKTKEVLFNNLTYPELIVDYSFDTNEDVKSLIDGVIGGQFLQNFNIILNYNEQSIYFKQNNRNNFTREILTDGIIYRDRRKDLGGLLVSAIIEHELVNTKFKLGDIILEINEQNVIELDYKEMRNLQNIESNIIHYKLLRRKREIDIVTEVHKIM